LLVGGGPLEPALCRASYSLVRGNLAELFVYRAFSLFIGGGLVEPY
jgi:hypothetical protein